jgi:hypothetical protein
MTDIFPDLEKKPKQQELFSDKEINSNKILEIDYKDLSDPMQLIDILTRRNQYHNTKKE